MSGIPVNVDNFIRAESERMFAALLMQAGGVNEWFHYRAPTPVDQQTVIRMNRDMLYSGAVVHISAGATVTIPEAGRRYISVVIVNQDHHVNAVFHDPGEHELTIERFGTPHVLAAARVLVDPAEPADVIAVNELQDQLGLKTGSTRPLVMPDYDQASLDATRAALLELAKGLHGFEHAFGAKGDVDPVHHLIATAAGWGGLPDREATYLNVNPGLPPGEYRLTVQNVTVDGFWSISLYNAGGYSSPTTVASIASTTSLPPPTTTGRSPSTSAAAATGGPTACRSWTGGTTSSACTGPDPRSSTAPGRSPPSSQVPDARLGASSVFPDEGLCQRPVRSHPQAAVRPLTGPLQGT